jgi:hypothetical protein
LKNSYILITLAAAWCAFGQEIAPPEEHPVSGSYVVSLGANVYKREKCDLSSGSALTERRARLTFRLACKLPHRIKAGGAVTIYRN